MNRPRDIATFRFEVISRLVDPLLSRDERRRARKDCLRQPAVWPSGEVKPVSRATLARWLRAWRARHFDGLVPAVRAVSQGSEKDGDTGILVTRAVYLLLERSDRSLNLLLKLLEPKSVEVGLTRSTLARRLTAHALWSLVKRLRKKQRRRRRRFEAADPHDLWQLDGKGVFVVRYTDGTSERLTALTILDDHSRDALSGAVAPSESLPVAVHVFRAAALEWGLPWRIYADRHSVYDSVVFRQGLAVFGVHRVRSRPKNAPARGKIEAFHRFMEAWFVKELRLKAIADRAEVEALFQVFLETYNTHPHRGLHTTPREKLAGRRSERMASLSDLQRAFVIEKEKKAHPKTGEVELSGFAFRVPSAYAGKRVLLRQDPEDPSRAVLVTKSGEELPLSPLVPPPEAPGPPPPAGPLERSVDHWRGRTLPQASPGFGLPEVFAAFSKALSRMVPASEREAEAVLDFYREHGPFAREAFLAALERLLAREGQGRPLSRLLTDLERFVKKPDSPDPEVIP